jgi:hypothetical protein
MSSQYKHKKNKPWNPVKSWNFNANWGKGEFTCMHTKADKKGAWWKGMFGGTYTVMEVQVLNRGDCCGGRLNGAKVFIGETLLGTITNPPQGEWINVKGVASGDFIEIKGAPEQHLHFCGL